MSPPPAPRALSRAEYVSDAVVHFAGLALALVAAARLHGDAPALVGTSVYGAALILMLGSSALYNMVLSPDWTWLLKRLDHSAIYMKIAGTYTPFTLITGQGLALTAGLWGAALLGVALKVAAPHRFRRAGVAAGGAMLAALPGTVVALMAVGGGLYTLGVAFYLWDRLPFHTAIWHLFVLAASVVFFAAVAVLLASR